MDELPFRKGTKIYQTFHILADGKWHCGKHELPGTQPAKAIQIIRQNGYEIKNKTIHCRVCNESTVHRKLASTTPTTAPVVRSVLPETLKRRVKVIYSNVEAITQRKYEPAELEVDHRFPQVRWSSPEGMNDPNMSDAEITAKFQLLTRQHNLWKSRYCERCVKTGTRGTFVGINYFYKGNSIWPEDIPWDDERGCYGCFWYNPEKWRQSLNDLIARRCEKVGEL
ncbi:hypothetical protein J8C06_13725 [Chloracidobacterium validum]|uniref:Restriction endonuclease n=1 Tax=Chloracidobacterium validum TaxID=2821543 RepID=A0ABX8BAZ4_9BACT|nr:hypothetical protein [Chloracidobacterium validum]QUW04106.1 hypothetical protein J8C06_13725 [Chloracidobacterium validum]